MYSKKIESGDFKVNPTVGFQYEEITIPLGKDLEATAGFWDIGGNEACMAVMQAITQNIKFGALIFVVDVTNEIKTKYGGIRQNLGGGVGGTKKLSYRNNIDETRLLVHRLMAEDEMRQVHTLAIVLNCRQGSDLYRDVFSTDTKTSVYLKRLEDERKAEDKKEPEEEVVDELAAKVAKTAAKKKASLKSSSILKREDDQKYPYKEQFLQRMKFSREVLDMGEVLEGMTDVLLVDNPEHELLIIDVFDVQKDKEARDHLFNKIIRQCALQNK